MSPQKKSVVAFFPPTTGRLGDLVLFRSFVADYVRPGPLTLCVLPDELFSLAGFNSSNQVHVVSRSERANSNLLDDYANEIWFCSEESLERDVLNQRPCLCLIGLSPTLTDIHRARARLGQLLANGHSPSSLWPFLWNKSIPGELPMDVVKEYVGPLKAVFPYDPLTLLTSENQGGMVQDHKPKAALARAIARLALDAQNFIKQPDSTEMSKNPSLDWRNLETAITVKLWDTVKNGGGISANSQRLSALIDQELHAQMIDCQLTVDNEVQLAATRQNIVDQLMGLGPLEPWMRDSSIGEIMVNGLDNIFIERNGVIEKTDTRFHSEAQLRVVIERVVGRMGRRVDWASPLCDARLPDGSRVNVVLPPLALNGPVVTLRRFKVLYQSIDDLIQAKTITSQQASLLREAVLSRKNIVVAGNSGAGKTTLLNILAGLIPSEERILTLEDAAELQIGQPHVIRLETRSKNAEGAGEIRMADLVTNALRMRPDRLIIGECRGAEVIPMLQAMNTGHDGCLSTLHANSASDALKRLESLVLLHAPEWPIHVVREQIQSALDLIVYVKRMGSERKVLDIIDV